MDDLQVLAERLAALEADKEAAAAANRRSGFMSKFGNMFGNDEEVGDMIMNSLTDAGGVNAVESATEEAISEYILKPIGDWAEKLCKTLGRAIEKKVDEVVEGTIPAEGAPAAPPQVDLPEDVGTEPLMPPPGAGSAMPPADMGGAPPVGDMSIAPQPPDAGIPPLPTDATGAPPLPPVQQPVISDERYKNIRPTVLSDERFKTLNLDTDDKLKALETLCSTKELSDEDLKEILFTPAQKKAETTVSDVTQKEVEQPKPKTVSMGSLNDIFSTFMDMDPETGTTLSDATKKDIAPPAPKAPERPVDESEAIMKDLSDFGLGNLNSILGRRY